MSLANFFIKFKTTSFCNACAKTLAINPKIFIDYNRLVFPTAFGVRWRKNWLNPFYREVYKRRTELGPEPERHRSVWSNWNYDAEIFAFGQRIGENFLDETLKRAFTHRSYLEEDIVKRTRLGMEVDMSVMDQTHNEELANNGYAFTNEYVKSYLESHFPRYPQEGISAVVRYLLSDEVASFVAANFGFTDLILCTDFPPEESTLSSTFFAVIGALLQDQGRDRAAGLIQDMLLTQLIGKDINSFWEITNPMGMLVDLLKADGKSEPESRLTRHAGDNTVVAVYYVGIYCGKQLIGEAPGETTTIAEEMAARDALKRIFGTEEHHQPLIFTYTTNDSQSNIDSISHDTEQTVDIPKLQTIK